jgi:hypothetical protein
MDFEFAVWQLIGHVAVIARGICLLGAILDWSNWRRRLTAAGVAAAVFAVDFLWAWVRLASSFSRGI